MSFTIDANLLLYAINEDSAFHAQAKTFIESCAESEQTWYIVWPVIHTFIRIATHAGIMYQPLLPGKAVSVIDSIIKLPHVQTINEDDKQFWGIYTDEIKKGHLRGNQLPDALIVAIMKSHGIRTIYTKDRDFLKFTDIKAIDPLE